MLNLNRYLHELSELDPSTSLASENCKKRAVIFTGRSSLVDSSLSCSQKSLMRQLEKLGWNTLPTNFPYHQSASNTKPLSVNLLAASYNNLRQYLLSKSD